MKKARKLIILFIFIVMIFSISSVLMYNSYEAKVSKDYNTIEYNNNIYINIDSLPEDCVLDKNIKAYQEGNSLYSQWLVSPMCYISNDKEYIEIITEDDTIPYKILYYKLDKI